MNNVIEFPKRKPTGQDLSKSVTTEFITSIIETLDVNGFDIREDNLMNELTAPIKLLEAIVDKRLGNENNLVPHLEKITNKLSLTKK